MSILKVMVFCALTLSLGFGQVAQARDGGECKADAEKLCPGVQPGTKEFRQCLKKNRDLLSAPCQAKLEKIKQKRLACKSDKEKFCKDIQPGGGRIKACMKQHESELSSQCRAVL